MSKSKTLVGNTKGKNERECDGLRDFEPPPEVKVFKATPNWLRSDITLNEFVRPEPPTSWSDISKEHNTRNKK